MFQNCQLPAPTLPPKRLILVPGKTVPIITIKPSNSLQSVNVNPNEYLIISPHSSNSLLSPSSYQSQSPYSDCGYSSSTPSTTYSDVNNASTCKIPQEVSDIDETVIQTVLAGKAPSQVNQPKKKQRRERLTNMSSEEKANRRKWRNRVAAQTARDRKKERTTILELALKKLIKENEELRRENARLSERNRELCNMIPANTLPTQTPSPQTNLESAVFDSKYVSDGQSQYDCSKNHGTSNDLQENDENDEELQDIIDEMLRDFKPSNDIEEVVRDISKNDYECKNWEGVEPLFMEEESVYFDGGISNGMEENSTQNGFWEMDQQRDYFNSDPEYQYMFEGNENPTQIEGVEYYYQ
uniref:X-box-binding protein 1 n=1 Tax=Strongyloides papillosus TaxID=174720 RepID=A0A0N5C6S0_STREA